MGKHDFRRACEPLHMLVCQLIGTRVSRMTVLNHLRLVLACVVGEAKVRSSFFQELHDLLDIPCGCAHLVQTIYVVRDDDITGFPYKRILYFFGAFDKSFVVYNLVCLYITDSPLVRDPDVNGPVAVGALFLNRSKLVLNTF